MSTHIAVHNLGRPRATSRQLLQTREKFRGQVNANRRKLSNGQEECFCKEVDGGRLDDCFVLVSDPVVTGKIQVVHFSGGTFYRLVVDGISDGPPKVGFSTNDNQTYGIKLYGSGCTEAYSKEVKRR